MAKKGEPVKKALELIYRLQFNKGFRTDVKAYRERLKAPGTSSLLLSMELIKKYNLPRVIYWEVNRYLRFGQLDALRSAEEETLSIRYPNAPDISTGDEQTFEKLKQPYVGLYIHDGSSREDVVKIIRRRWKQIQGSLRSQGGNVSRIRSAANKKSVGRVFKLLDSSVGSLRKRVGVQDLAISKDALVARIMTSEGKKQFTARMVRRIRERKG